MSNNLDSLIQVLENDNIGDTVRYYALRDVAFRHSNPQIQIEYSNQLIDFAARNEDPLWQYIGYHCLGNAYTHLSDLENAIKAYSAGLKNASNAHYDRGVALSYQAMADVYSEQSNVEAALGYYYKAISAIKDLPEESRNTLSVAYTNIGDTYLQADQLDSALHYFAESIKYTPAGYDQDVAINKGNIGLVYAKKGQFQTAEEYINQARSILEDLDDPFAISALSVFLTYMADIYLERGNIDKATDHAHRALEIAEELGYRSEMRDANKKLADLYALKDDYESAYDYHLQYVALRDSINNLEVIQKMADQRTELEVGQKQAELDVITAQQKTERVILFAIAGFALILVVLAIIIYKYYQSKARVNLILEKQKSELESLNSTKDKFFSIISHDLRGPVSSFFGISRMIKFLVESKETDQLIEIADDIDQSVERLSSLLDNLLSWAMQQQGQVPFNPEMLSLKEVIEDQVATFHNMAESKKITLHSEITEDVSLQADKNMTQTILRNLVNNALKFTPEGGKVTLSGERQNGTALIKVNDTGVGIPQDKLNELFNLQDKKSTYGTSGEKGLGLGLQLVHEFVGLHQGGIWVESKEGKGSSFVVQLPTAESN